jgi:hypothetical protein
MNADTTMGRAKVRPGNFTTALRTDPLMDSAALAALERWCDSQAEAELNWLLKQSGLKPHSVATLVSML